MYDDQLGVNTRILVLVDCATIIFHMHFIIAILAKNYWIVVIDVDISLAYSMVI